MADCHDGHTQNTCPKTCSKKWSSFLPLPFFPYSPPFPWKHLEEYFDPYRQNHVLTHVWEINPMCLQNLRYKVVAKGWPFTRPWKTGLLQPVAGAHALHRPSWSWHGSTQHAAWPAVAVPSRHCCSLSHGPEGQRLKKLHISCAVPNTSHLYNTHLLRFGCNVQSTYIWSKGVNIPGNALLPWFMEIVCGCALQSNVIHSKSCLIGNCPRKLSKPHTFYCHTKPPSFTAQRATT